MEQRFDIRELERLRRLAAFMILEYGPEETIIEAAHKDDPTARALRVLAEIKTLQPSPTADAKPIADRTSRALKA
ncbi:MAG: hypothetical protein B7Z29_08185 [Hyphomicrobium sp. 12-62-95]|nr:MAG: hypothetical protein B7Z29_08185 [Hyphomicrobium sp. 12-62-95]